MKTLYLILVSLLLVGCASKSSMPLGNGLVQIDVSAAPVYGRSGAQKLAFKEAARVTVEQGHDKFVVVNSDSWNELGVSGGSYGHFYGNQNSYSGNYSSGFSTARNPEVKMIIRMLDYDDDNAEQAIDAHKIIEEESSPSSSKG